MSIQPTNIAINHAQYKPYAIKTLIRKNFAELTKAQETKQKTIRVFDRMMAARCNGESFISCE